jgi:uncharacterized delta-60 repeat protein
LIAALATLAPPAAAGAVRTGALDRSFGVNGRAVTQTELGGGSWLHTHVHVAEGPDETIVAAVGDTVFRFLADGSLDTSFGEGGRLTIDDPEGLPFTLHDLAVDGQGRIALAGTVELPEEILVSYIGPYIHGPLAAVIRYSADGKLDTSFGEKGGYVLSELNQPPLNSYYGKAATSAEEAIADSAGNVTLIGGLGGYMTGIRSEYRMAPRLVARLTAGGHLDTSFGDGGVIGETGFDGLGAVAPYGDGLLLSGRQRSGQQEPWSEALTRLNSDGSVDRSFGHDGRSADLFAPPLAGLAADGRGRIVVLGGHGVLRLTHRGTRDRRFGHRGGTTVKLPGESNLSAVSIESSGRILLAGTQAIAKRQPETSVKERKYRRSFTVIGLNAHGQPDRRFGHDGWVATRFGKRSSALADEAFIDRSGRLVVAGTVARPDLAPTGGIALARYRLGR